MCTGLCCISSGHCILGVFLGSYSFAVQFGAKDHTWPITPHYRTPFQKTCRRIRPVRRTRFPAILARLRPQGRKTQKSAGSNRWSGITMENGQLLKPTRSISGVSENSGRRPERAVAGRVRQLPHKDMDSLGVCRSGHHIPEVETLLSLACLLLPTCIREPLNN